MNQRPLGIVVVGPLTGPGGIAELCRYMRQAAPRVNTVRWAFVDSTAPRPRLLRGFRRALFGLGTCYRTIKATRSLQLPGTTLVHVHSSHGKAFLEKALLCQVCKTLGVPTLLHINGSRFDTAYNSAPTWRKFLIRWLLRRPSCVISTGRYWQEFYRSVLSAREHPNVKVLHNAVPLPKLDADGRRESPECTVLFVGSVGDRKGCREILEGAKLIETQNSDSVIRFRLVGDSETEGDLERYRRLAKTMGLRSVVFAGRKEKSAKEDEFRRADIFLLPSHAENLPVAILEAMSYGLPMISTSVGAIPEVVGPDNGIRIPCGDAAALADAVRRLAGDRPLRCMMGQRSRSLIVERFTIDRFMTELVDICRRLVSHVGSPN